MRTFASPFGRVHVWFRNGAWFSGYRIGCTRLAYACGRTAAEAYDKHAATFAAYFPFTA